MKLSVVTICYNSAKTIEDTIKSVLSQTYKDVEYVIVDGGSTDGTLNIIKKYQDKISIFMSEKDDGIYDAMNKGIALANGEIINILNSDDFYKDDKVLTKVVQEFKKNNSDAVYGNILYVDRENKEKVVRIWKAGVYKKKKLSNGWAPPHPALFLKKEIYNKFGNFNLNFKIAADYELVLRFLLNDVKMSYMNEELVYMREGGFSARGIKQRKKGWVELKKAWLVNGKNVPILFILRRILFKVKQFIV